MKKVLLPAAAAAFALLGTAAMAQPYGYYGGSTYDRGYGGYGYDGYGYDGGRYHRYAYRDSDGDGIPDRAEWGRDRDHDGRPDQWDRYDNRRDRHHHHRRYGGYGWRYDASPYRYGYGY